MNNQVRMVFTPHYKSYKETLLSPYPIAVDKCFSSVVKLYINNIQSYDELTEYISLDRHAYELCVSEERRLYFDLDGLELTKKECSELITTLKTTIEEQVKCSVGIPIVLVNEGKTIYSIHLIFKDYSMDYNDQKELAEHINTLNIRNEKSLLDTSIYSKNRLFRLLGQTKMNSKEHKGIKFVFFKYGNYIPSVLDSFVCNIKDTHSIHYKKPIIKRVVLKKNLTPKELAKYILDNKFHSIFVDNIKKSWNKISLIVSNYSLYPIEEWCEKSAQLNPIYTKEGNLEYINSNINNGGIDLLYYIMNNYIVEQPYMFYRMDTDLYYEYLSRYFECVDKLIAFINTDTEHKGKAVVKLDFYDKGIQYELNKRTGFITGKDFTINYHYDTIVPKEFANIEFKQNIVECSESLVNWFETNSRLFVLKSSWGTGKTLNILKKALDINIHRKILILTSSNSLNKTNKSDLNQFIQSNDYGASLFVSHMDTQVDNSLKLKNHNKVICSIQSLHKVCDCYYDLIVMDEFESIINGYAGWTTFTKSKPIADEFSILYKLLNRANKVIALDADISKSKIDLLVDILKEDRPIIIKNQQLSFQSVSFIIHTKDFIYNIFEDLIDNKKLVIPSATKKEAEKILYVLSNNIANDTSISKEYKVLVVKNYDMIKHNKILYIDREGCKLYKNEGGEYHIATKVENIYDDIEKFIIDNDIRIFIYTPTITCGISINSLYFHKSYSIANEHSVNYLEFIQMIMRVRQLIDNESNIFISPKCFNTYSKNEKLETIKENQIARIKFINLLEKSKWYDDNKELVEEITNKCIEDLNETHYSKIQLINALNKVNTEHNLVYNLYETLKYHKLKIEYYIGKNDMEAVYDPQLNKELTSESKFKEWDKLWIYPLNIYYEECCRYKNEGQSTKNIRYEKLYYPPNKLLKDTYYKTKMIINTLKIQNYITEDLDDYIANENYDKVVETIEMEYKTRRGQRHKLINLMSVEDIFLDKGEEHRKQYWEVYVEKQKYSSLKYLRNIHKETSKFDMTNTELDTIRIDTEILKVFIKALKINVYSTESYTFSNKEFNSIIDKNHSKELQELFVLYQKAHDIKPSTGSNPYYKLLKDLMKKLDYDCQYQSKDKNTSRQSSKFVISPAFEFVDRTPPVKVDYTTLDLRFNHLQDRSNNIKLYEPYDITEAKKMLEFFIQGKTKKVNLNRLRTTLLMFDIDTLTNIGFDNKMFYYSPFYYKVLSGDKYTHEYYVNRHKKVETIDLHTSQIVVYEDKSIKQIVRPYKPNQVVMKNITRLEPNEDKIEEFIGDFLNEMINNVCLGSELKETFNKKQSGLVRL